MIWNLTKNWQYECDLYFTQYWLNDCNIWVVRDGSRSNHYEELRLDSFQIFIWRITVSVCDIRWYVLPTYVQYVHTTNIRLNKNVICIIVHVKRSFVIYISFLHIHISSHIKLSGMKNQVVQKLIFWSNTKSQENNNN